MIRLNRNDREGHGDHGDRNDAATRGGASVAESVRRASGDGAEEMKAGSVGRMDPICHWLGLLQRMLKLPADIQSAVVVELESHLREHVRDLMLEGLNEDQAMRRAIADLGDAAGLAASLRSAHRPHRRMLMHVALFAIAGSALGLSVFAIRGPAQSGPVAADTPPESSLLARTPVAPAGNSSGGQAGPAIAPRAGAAAGAGGASNLLAPAAESLDEAQLRLTNLLASRAAAEATSAAYARAARRYTTHEGETFTPESIAPIEGRVTVSLADVTLVEAANAIGKSINKPFYFHATAWGEFKDKRVTLELKDAGIDLTMRVLNDALSMHGGYALVARQLDGTIEVAPQMYFDKLERRLVSYNISALEDGDICMDELLPTITELVEPDAWREHGGESAMGKVLGNRLLIEAPPRMHARIAWVLRQLKESGSADTIRWHIDMPDCAPTPAPISAPAAPARIPGAVIVMADQDARIALAPELVVDSQGPLIADRVDLHPGLIAQTRSRANGTR